MQDGKERTNLVKRLNQDLPFDFDARKNASIFASVKKNQV